MEYVLIIVFMVLWMGFYFLESRRWYRILSVYDQNYREQLEAIKEITETLHFHTSILSRIDERVK